MKIYLAGKMDAKHGAWRDGIIDTAYDRVAGHTRPRWELVLPGEFYDSEAPSAFVWPRQANTWVLGLHDFVGPYRSTFRKDWDPKYGGYFHGTPCSGQHGMADQDEHRAPVVANCIDAIQRADLVFAYLNSPDCFGTLAEIGMARAMGKFTYLAIDESAMWDWDDYWFLEGIVSAFGRSWNIWRGETPKSEKDRLRGYMQDALVKWTGRPEKSSPVALVQRDETEPYIRALQEAANSFSQIGRWSSDPRVRNEAQRMLKRIAG